MTLNLISFLIPNNAYAVVMGGCGTGCINMIYQQLPLCETIVLKTAAPLFLAGIVLFFVLHTVFVKRVIEKKRLFLLKVVFGIACIAVAMSIGYVAFQKNYKYMYCRNGIFK